MDGGEKGGGGGGDGGGLFQMTFHRPAVSSSPPTPNNETLRRPTVCHFVSYHIINISRVPFLTEILFGRLQCTLLTAGNPMTVLSPPLRF